MIAANRKGEENENNIGSKERGAALQQKKKPIIKSIQEYVNTCPFMAGGKVDEAYISLFMTYVIEPAEGESIYKMYTEGSGVRQISFTITSKEYFDSASREAISESGLSQYLEEWMEENNHHNIYPELEGYKSVWTEVTRSGYLPINADGQSRYQIQCKLIYE